MPGKRVEQWLFLLLLVAYGWLFVYFGKINNPNEMVRIYMARAIAEHGTYAIGERVRGADGQLIDRGPVYSDWGYVNDKALVCRGGQAPACEGTLYAAKAPGPSLLAVPVVAALRPALLAMTGAPPSRAAYVFALRWLLCILPTIAFWIALRRFLLAHAVEPAVALACVLCGALGSLSLTYGQMFAGHQLSSLALGVALLAGFWPGRSLAFLVGLGAGTAICMEYQAGPAALLISGAWLLVRRPGLRGFALAALGSVLPLLLLAHFHWAAFGAPWSTGYSHLENPGYVVDMAPGPFGISSPTWERVGGSLFAPYLGLFYWAPWILLIGHAAFWQGFGAGAGRGAGAGAGRGAALTACAVTGYYLVFQITQSLWRSGWAVGPRYMTPLVPMAAVAIGLSLAGRRLLLLSVLGGAGAAGVLATGIASAISQGFPPEPFNPLVEVALPLLAHGYVPRNLLQAAGVPGLWSALPYFLALGIAIVLLLTAPLRLPAVVRGRATGAIAALAIFLLLAAVQLGARRGSDAGAARFLTSVWEPNPPPGATPF